MSEQNPFARSRSTGFRSVSAPTHRPGSNPLAGRPAPRRPDDDDEREPPREQKIVSRSKALEITGVSADTLRRWVRDGLIWPWEYAPGWQWYHIDDIRNLQRDMARRKGGRPVEGLGSFQDRADLDAEVELMLAEVLADLAERDVTTDAAVRAVKRWAKTIHNHPRTPQ